MDSSSSSKVALDLSPMLKIYEDGHVERLLGNETVPPSLDPKTQVQSKDVLYCPQHNLSSRLYLPKPSTPNKKLPLLVYFHGGGFFIETAFSPTYHNYLNQLVAEANIIVVSVDYRRAPEHHLPAAYDDSWTALKWVASHFNGNGPETWLNEYADLGKVFLAGDSAGANIAHHMGIRYGQDKIPGINILGIVLIHPYFWGKEAVGDEPKILEMRSKVEGFWTFANPTSSGVDDPLINPCVDQNLGKIGCRKVLVTVAENDILKSRGWYYYEKLKASGWEGEAEIMEAKDENHVFHLFNPSCENAFAMLKKVSSFLNQAN
ncbi:hypothetical protein JCGZ_22845 [Jatropha curcas]|uniref:Alpha/beta hydrolase fold-3 domain-containing protein n=1 Tax=Jatropha curcas TaxID=180498 RepID=A0A067K102_JATCU|nr:probable carboxylesterase 7 [Jatropha curcas]KDP25940.1 hypothetical protein JCGZ_22845 [Jatropha curcas]